MQSFFSSSIASVVSATAEPEGEEAVEGGGVLERK